MKRAAGSSEGPSLVTQLSSQSEGFIDLRAEHWDIVVRQARAAGVLARLAFRIDETVGLDQVPEHPRNHLVGARTLALKHARDVRWEVTSVREVLASSGVPIILLKGAAYLMADLPPARGRLFADIDFMVPRERIKEVEEILLESEWFSQVKDPYNQLYYRRWTHQIPPLQHHRRSTILDVHHSIVPLTARSTVNAEVLASASLPLGGDAQLRVLGPCDMVLHSAVHLFNEGEFHRGLRDLLDLDDLILHFGSQTEFWNALPARAEALGLTAPLYFTLRYRERILGRTLPHALRQAMKSWELSGAKRAFFDAVFIRALRPVHSTYDDAFSGIARWLLYVRAHYLRMPLYLLLPHLLRKSFHRAAKD